MNERGRQAKQEALKGIIRALHGGLPLEQARDRFRKEVGAIGTQELVAIEQSLIEEGLPPEEVARFCNVHVLLVQDALETRGGAMSAGGPAEKLRRENARIRALVGELRGLAAQRARVAEIARAVAQLERLDRHYALKENAIFPYLERHGFPGPSKVMWQKDDEIRGLLKKSRQELARLPSEVSLPDEIAKTVLEPLAAEVEGMIDKEEQILLPAAAERLSSEEWAAAAIAMDEIGYAFLEDSRTQAKADVAAASDSGQAREPGYAEGSGSPPLPAGDMVELPSGSMNREELEAILDTLPVDLTFVDADDRVRYFNEVKERIFVRTRSVLGRSVQNCHPPKSLAAVQRILDEFRAGTADHHDFWIRMGERLVYIRYFAVRDRNGRYLGTLEVTQDVTGIQQLRGEKRLLD